MFRQIFGNGATATSLHRIRPKAGRPITSSLLRNASRQKEPTWRALEAVESCIVHTPDKARLIERLPEGNRRAALDALSEICPKNASIVNRVRAWNQLGLRATPCRASNSTIDGPDAKCAAHAKASKPEYIGESIPIVRRTVCASTVEKFSKRRLWFFIWGSGDYNNNCIERSRFAGSLGSGSVKESIDVRCQSAVTRPRYDTTATKIHS